MTPLQSDWNTWPKPRLLKSILETEAFCCGECRSPIKVGKIFNDEVADSSSPKTKIRSQILAVEKQL